MFPFCRLHSAFPYAFLNSFLHHLLDFIPLDFLHNNRFGYLEYSTNNRNGQVFWSMIQKFSFYTVRPTKISLESTGVFKSAVARKCNSFKYYYLKYKITLGDVYEI